MFRAKPSTLSGSAASQGGQYIVQSLTAYINRSIKRREPISVQQFCESSGYSQPTLYRKVVEATGLPPKQLMAKLQCKHARILLRSTDLTVVQIAYRCGFSSGNYFAKVFRQHCQCTPSEFRKKLT
jgi:AraC-like DNA-binding protein